MQNSDFATQNSDFDMQNSGFDMQNSDFATLHRGNSFCLTKETKKGESVILPPFSLYKPYVVRFPIAQCIQLVSGTVIRFNK